MEMVQWPLLALGTSVATASSMLNTNRTVEIFSVVKLKLINVSLGLVIKKKMFHA